ncbi:hypothetical protein ACSEPQ_28220 [Pseudomonas aeruginosa]|uniref:hypothetical protein n=1 Tax=Pseudomonas aeruginosa TaxID=287 RepID=UPI001586F590|nr:hypothetical protein [Pseudomonas aeruginosa]EKX8710649.1 hypothetical protein [Pseudomonas aeruginosa]MBI8611008.1 hypothetical protein [Pseudomonas aeruginosa]WCX86896.1 hypothetical protein KK177_15830 [Pseudomonas aeruginosa]HBP0748148.1 hypothetical protein [Pseudomonas aeruginosa]
MPPKNVRLILDNPSGDSFCAASALAERLAFGCKRSRTVWRARGSCGFEDRRSA